MRQELTLSDHDARIAVEVRDADHLHPLQRVPKVTGQLCEWASLPGRKASEVVDRQAERADEVEAGPARKNSKQRQGPRLAEPCQSPAELSCPDLEGVLSRQPAGQRQNFLEGDVFVHSATIPARS